MVFASRLHFTHWLSCAMKARDECCGLVSYIPVWLACRIFFMLVQDGSLIVLFCIYLMNMFTVECVHVRDCMSLAASGMCNTSLCGCLLIFCFTCVRLVRHVCLIFCAGMRLPPSDFLSSSPHHVSFFCPCIPSPPLFQHPSFSSL